MSDLPRRTVTALVYGAVVLGLVSAPREIFVAGLTVTTVLALLELLKLRSAGAAALLELAVVVLGMASLLFLRVVTDPACGIRGCGPFGPLTMTIVAVWAADVVAYVAGSRVGRRKIVPRISPGKTWEGTVAGLLAAAAVVIFWPLGRPLWAVVAAVLIGPAAFAGDLLESWVKRRAGVKDSGTLLPGHGGILDRIDSLAAASILVAAAVALVGRMG